MSERSPRTDLGILRRFVGRDDWPPTEWDSSGELTRWVGKPWRRIEVVTRTYTWKGETEVTDRTVQLHLGSRRLGLAMTLILSRTQYDYSEEQQ